MDLVNFLMPLYLFLMALFLVAEDFALSDMSTCRQRKRKGEKIEIKGRRKKKRKESGKRKW